MYDFIAPLLFLIIIASTFQTEDTKFKIWTGYQLNNTVPISEVQLSRNMIQCASKCLNRQTCMAASFNDASMECDLHGAQQDIIIVTENIEDHYYLIIPEDTEVVNYTDAKLIQGSEQKKNWTIMGAADCYLNNSEEYRGTIDYTVSGKTCQAWNVNLPHTVDYQPIDPTAGTTNYCRETTHREGGPVCYTTDPAMKWEYCFIVKCDACGVDAYLPVTPPGTTYSFYVGMFIGMAFTCISRSPGVSVPHCPVAQCGEDDQWTTNHVVSCTDEDCYTDSTLYIGKVSCTRGGIDCQVWNLTSGGQMPTTPDKYTNYCRDPDNTGKPWCYTTVPGVRWDYCHVPEC